MENSQYQNKSRKAEYSSIPVSVEKLPCSRNEIAVFVRTGNLLEAIELLDRFGPG
jgi:hypothetical protein